MLVMRLTSVACLKYDKHGEYYERRSQNELTKYRTRKVVPAGAFAFISVSPIRFIASHVEVVMCAPEILEAKSCQWSVSLAVTRPKFSLILVVNEVKHGFHLDIGWIYTHNAESRGIGRVEVLQEETDHSLQERPISKFQFTTSMPTRTSSV